MSALCFNESGTENISLETMSTFSLKKKEREWRELSSEREEGFGIQVH